MTRSIRVQSDSNAHDRSCRVAVEQGYFAAGGLDVEYTEDNPRGVEGRCEYFTQRWNKSQLKGGALGVYPVCEWGAVEWLRVDEARQRSQLLRDLKPELQKGGLLPELIGAERTARTASSKRRAG